MSNALLEKPGSPAWINNFKGHWAYGPTIGFLLRDTKAFEGYNSKTEKGVGKERTTP